jgi:ferritin-like metal-binding protein YciE
MSNAKERLAQWLRDAHAMEEQAETMLSSQAGRLENYPVLRERISKHVEETRSQAKRIEGCLERMGESTSTMKDTTGKMVAMAQGMSGLFVGDEVMKGTMAGYTFEHMEIASYRILIATAEAAGDAETKRVCEEILREEEAMAQWLASQMPETTRQFLARDAEPGVTAKH